MTDKWLSWPGVIASAVLAGALCVLVVFAMNRWLFDTGDFGWGDAASPAAGAFLGMLVVGLAMRRGWLPRSRSDHPDRRR